MAFPWVGARGIRRPPMGRAMRHDRELERSSFAKPPKQPKSQGLTLKQLMTGGMGAGAGTKQVTSAWGK
jgi:hypothetical protein